MGHTSICLARMIHPPLWLSAFWGTEGLRPCILSALGNRLLALSCNRVASRAPADSRCRLKVRARAVPWPVAAPAPEVVALTVAAGATGQGAVSAASPGDPERPETHGEGRSPRSGLSSFRPHCGSASVWRSAERCQGLARGSRSVTNRLLCSLAGSSVRRRP